MLSKSHKTYILKSLYVFVVYFHIMLACSKIARRMLFMAGQIDKQLNERNKMTKLTSGTKVQVTSHCEDKWIGIIGVVDFQCASTLGVEGLVYINWIPKGKRKEVSKAFHSSHLTVI